MKNKCTVKLPGIHSPARRLRYSALAPALGRFTAAGPVPVSPPVPQGIATVAPLFKAQPGHGGSSSPDRR